MASRILGVVLFGMLLASPLMIVAEKTFDFYYLVLLWPGAYCAQSGCCEPATGLPAKDFSLRGLLPYNSTTGHEVTKCNKTSFYIDQLSSLKDDLYAYWSNIKCPSNNGVSTWKSTWKTYGICSGKNETEYFKAALELRAKVDVLSLLAKREIYPDYKRYEKSAIIGAIKEGLGVTPAIRCSKGPFSVFQLYEIYICVDKSGDNFIDCPIYPNFTCSSTILFHPFQYWMLTSGDSPSSPATASI